MEAGLGPTESEVFAELNDSASSSAIEKFDAQSKTANDKLGDEMWKEPRQKRRFRNLMFWAFFFLLLAQHGLLVWFICAMVSAGLVKEIQFLLGTIISATLCETYKIFQTMVGFIFSPGNFDMLTKNGGVSKSGS